jgi:putative addiction module killer protein
MPTPHAARLLIERIPGYRVYCGRDGDVLLVLLTGGTKQRQQRDIGTAKANRADYERLRPRTQPR